MYTLGIDLGGTNIAVGVVNDSYQIVGSAKCKTLATRPTEEIINDMADTARKAVENAGLTMADIKAVGVGCPGSVNPYDGVVYTSCNLPFSNLQLRKMLSERLDHLPIYMDNDANAAAYGEMIAGVGKGTSNFAAITIGTGVGGGVIVENKMVIGFNCAGGEIGHIVIQMDGEPCGCGRNGCFESYASATALVRQTKAAMNEHKDSKMWEIAGGDINEVDGRTAFDGLRQGDETAKAVVAQFAKYLACGITNVINIFQPEVLCVGGGVSKEGEVLLAPVREYVEHFRYSKNAPAQTEIKAAVLGNDAGIIGAAYLFNLYGEQ